MIYRVVLQRLAIADLQESYDYAAGHSPIDADRWLTRFQTALQTLQERPDRCSDARESGKLQTKLYEFLFGKRPYNFRVVFVIDGGVVRILRIRRAQRRPLTANALRNALSDE